MTLLIVAIAVFFGIHLVPTMTELRGRLSAAARDFYTKYYNEDLHLGAFMLPTFARENIDG